MKILDIFFELKIDYDIEFYDTVCKIVVTSGSDVDQMLDILFDASDMMNFLMESEDNNEVCIIKIPKNVLMQELPDKIKDRVRNFKSSSPIVSHTTTDNENYKGLWIIDNLEFENTGIEDDHFKLRLIHNPDKLTDEAILAKLLHINVYARVSISQSLNNKKRIGSVFTFDVHTLPNLFELGTPSPSVNMLEAFLRYKSAKDCKIITGITMSDIIPVKIFEKAKYIDPCCIDMYQTQAVVNMKSGDPFNQVIVITHTNGDMVCFLPNKNARFFPTINPYRNTWDIGLNNYYRVNVFESYIRILSEQADLRTLCEIIQSPSRKRTH